MSRIKKEGVQNHELKVLLVEDHPVLRKVYQCLLTDLGCWVDDVASGQEALAHAQKPYDLIFLDLGLPDVHGMTLIQLLHDLPSNATTPIIVLTAHAEGSTTLACLELGAREIMIKPVNKEELQRIVQNYRTC